jgi:hypothetical protein
MKLIERYLQSCIDRALDDGKPLTGLTRQLVLRHERLRYYYESMLALELELRFSDETPAVKPFVVPAKSVSYKQHKRLLAAGSTIAVCLLIAVGILFQGTPEMPSSGSLSPVDVAAAESFDDVFHETLTAFAPAESLIDFSERPLELTATLLAQVGSIVTKNFPAEMPE